MQREAVTAIMEAEALEPAVESEGEQHVCSHSAFGTNPPDSIQHTMKFVMDKISHKNVVGQSSSHSLVEPL